MNDDDATGPTERFGDRAGPYMRHRPDYPEALFDHLEEQGYLRMGMNVAEMGAGTGIFSEQLIGRGCEVWAVEPNGSMQSVAEATLGRRTLFHSVPAAAEETPLDDDAVELVVVAQAFHWLDLERTTAEFERILEPPHRVALVWQLRKTEIDEFHEDLEALLRRHGLDFEETIGAVDECIEALPDVFGGELGEAYDHETFDHVQPLDRQGLQGLLSSFSYLPRPSDDGYEAMVEAIDELFEAHAEDGEVRLQYDTELYAGTLS